MALFKSLQIRRMTYPRWNYTIEVYRNLGEALILTPQSTVWSYLVDLLQALQHLHEHNHIHMDIKPENIFIGRDGICKVGDFGLMLDLSAADARKQAMEGDSRLLSSQPIVSPLDFDPSQVSCARDVAGPVHKGMRCLQPGNHNVGACLRLGPAQARRPLAEDQDGGT